jgi:hypothetical protein
VPCSPPRRRVVTLLLVLAVTVAACGGSSDAALPQLPSTPEPSPLLERGGLVVVLPAVDQLDAEERARVRLLVERAVSSALPSSVRPELIEPATAATVGAVVEAAARRVDAVCVLGASGVAALVAVRELYPALHGCVLPMLQEPLDAAATEAGSTAAFSAAVPGIPTSSVVPVDGGAALDGIALDLRAVGATLGRSAREVAGPGIVVVLDGGDPLLDRRWALGVTEGAEESTDGAPAPVRVVRSVDEVLALVASTSNGSPSDEPSGGDAGSGRPGLPATPGTARAPGIRRDVGDGASERDRDGDPSGPALLPVGAVVLDASPGTDALASLLLDAGVPVVVPRSLVGERQDDAAIILRWRIRWDVALVPLLRRAAAAVGAEATTTNGSALPDAPQELLALDEGPALVAARARLRSDDLR